MLSYKLFEIFFCQPLISTSNGSMLIYTNHLRAVQSFQLSADSVIPHAVHLRWGEVFHYPTMNLHWKSEPFVLWVWVTLKVDSDIKLCPH
jgi:hypothetical protein